MRVSIGQFEPVCGDWEGNLKRMAEKIYEASTAGAEFIAFPEICTVGYALGKQMSDFAEDANGRTYQFLKNMAQKQGIAIGYGYPENSRGSPYNSYQVIDSKGDSLANYRKSRLFGAYEREVFQAGRRSPTIFNIGDAKVVILICYEIMFSELSLAAADEGAQILLYPSAGESSLAGADFNRSVTATRALECGSYAVYPNCCGNDGVKSYRGCSVVAGPDGSILAEAEEKPSTLSTDLNLRDLEIFRCDSPYITDRRAMSGLNPGCVKT